MLLFFLLLLIRILKKISQVPKQYEEAQLFPNIDNNQHTGMISEGSHDTEDWSNDAEKSALIT